MQGFAMGMRSLANGCDTAYHDVLLKRLCSCCRRGGFGLWLPAGSIRSILVWFGSGLKVWMGCAVCRCWGTMMRVVC
jgi:hypothetical protein